MQRPDPHRGLPLDARVPSLQSCGAGIPSTVAGDLLPAASRCYLRERCDSFTGSHCIQWVAGHLLQHLDEHLYQRQYGDPARRRNRHHRCHTGGQLVVGSSRSCYQYSCGRSPGGWDLHTDPVSRLFIHRGQWGDRQSVLGILPRRQWAEQWLPLGRDELCDNPVSRIFRY